MDEIDHIIMIIQKRTNILHAYQAHVVSSSLYEYNDQF